jgi:nucleoside 2-deoxyribosyltransferase
MKYDFYLAGPFFNEQQKAVMAQARAILEEAGFKVADPQELGAVIVDLKEEEKTEEKFKRIFQSNIEGMINSNSIMACIDERDTGTAFELGFFYLMKLSEPHRRVYTFSSADKPANVMLSQAADGHARTLDDLRNVNFETAATSE